MTAPEFPGAGARFRAALVRIRGLDHQPAAPNILTTLAFAPA